MNILLLGSGGREHALAWKISQSSKCSQLYIAPGNAGTQQAGINLPIENTDFDSIIEACKEHDIELLIVGPEEPLVKGVVDAVLEILPDMKVIGPAKNASQLEGSKAFAKEFMARHQIPTAAYQEFTIDNFVEGTHYLQKHALPIVLKADGLAGGKGVIICQNHVEATAEFELMIHRAKFGEAGKKVVVEDFLDGIELSVFVLTDGKNFCILPEAKDYKRVGEKDKGLNTGGMGAISPVPFADDDFMNKVRTKIIEPTIRGLEKDQLEYKGFLFFGLIKVDDEPFVIEYNCRMGDPETEVVIPRIKSDLVEILIATADGKLDEVSIEIDPRHASTIVAVSGGYPNYYEKGYEITGLDKDEMIFHMGTKSEGEKVLTNGGRVLCATALAADLSSALAESRKMIEAVDFEDKYFRGDIGWEFV